MQNVQNKQKSARNKQNGKKRQILNVLTGDAIVSKSQKHLFAY